jgi:hypothetical protein
LQPRSISGWPGHSKRRRLAVDSQKIIEFLECAKVNADNIKRGGLVFIELVKVQIDGAIKMLNEDDEA